MQQAHYQCHRPTPWMQESVSMNARKCVHECQKVCPWMQESVSMNARKCVHECKKVCPWMQESVSMNARKCVHAQKPYPSQAFAHESSKVGEEEKEITKDRGELICFSWYIALVTQVSPSVGVLDVTVHVTIFLRNLQRGVYTLKRKIEEHGYCRISGGHNFFHSLGELELKMNLF